METQGEKRFAAVVPKKVATLAVKRSFLRRRAKSAYRALSNEVSNNHSIVLFLKKEALSATREDIFNDMKSMLQKSGLLIQ